jgi:hypothetical protein
MFHKEGTKTILLGIILQQLYYYYLTILLCGLQLAQIGAFFDIINHLTIFQKP